MGWDLLFLAPGESGGRETYARELLTALAVARPDIRVTAFVNAPTAAADHGFWSECADRVVVLPRATPHRRASWAVAELAALPLAAARAGVEILHSPANFGPWGGPFARVLTLHDVLWRRLPELHAPAVARVTQALVLPAARRAHAVITVSEASRREIAGELGVRPERVVTVPNGVAPPPQRVSGARARALLALGDRRVALSVGTFLPHKNQAGLLAGLAAMAPGDRPLLVLAGHGTDGAALRERAAALGLEADVRLAGALSPAQLEDLYAAADVMVTATRYEGFGLPVLEAMARGLPVACSDLPVLREVAGGAAVWLDAERPDSIAAALHGVLGDPARAEALRARGRERAAAFSWDATAAAVARCYEASARRYAAR